MKPYQFSNALDSKNSTFSILYIKARLEMAQKSYQTSCLAKGRGILTAQITH